MTLFCALALLPLQSHGSVATTLRIEGVDDPEVTRQLDAYLEIPETVERADYGPLADQLVKSAEKAVQALGYYNAKFAVHEDKSSDDVLAMVLTVELNEPVKINSLDLTISGDAGRDSAFENLDETRQLKIGKIFNHGHYENLKAKLAGLAQSRGYFDAEFQHSGVVVDPSRNSAEIKIDFAAGVRYTLGEVRFTDSPLGPTTLNHWVTFEPGTPYASRHIAALTNNLLDSGYFSQVRVIPEHDKSSDYEIPVRVETETSPDNRVNFGIGFATDTGPRGRIGWDKPLINERGHSFSSELTASSFRQSISARYQIPANSAPRTNFYAIEAGALREKVDDRIDRFLTTSLQHVSLTSNGWQRTDSIRWEDHRFTISDRNQETRLYLPGVGWSRTQRRGGIFPEWGNRYSFRLQGASRDLGSDVDIAKVVTSGKWLRSLADTDHYLLFRADLGALSTNDLNRIPPSHRFFAGGDQSIRGFSYQSLGPEDADGDVIGGRYLAVASAEIVFGITEKWGWALFTDTGGAFNDTSEPTHTGVGTGVRWRSPIGPLRIDLAVGVSDDDDPIRLHLSIGPEL